MTEYTARPTTYAGIQMRSRLEAGFAAMLDKEGVPWEFEPECFAGPTGQYLPDFRIGAEQTYVEVKSPRVLASWADIWVSLDRLTIIRASLPAADLQLVVGDNPHGGWEWRACLALPPGQTEWRVAYWSFQAPALLTLGQRHA